MAEAWWVDKRDRNGGRVAIKDENGLLVGDVIEEDAPLMAKAPKLAEVVEEVLAEVGDLPSEAISVDVRLPRELIERMRKILDLDVCEEAEEEDESDED